MTNISKQKREKMILFLETIKEQHNDDESIIALNEIEKVLTDKKYGLVWEEHTERVDEEMKTKIPVFIEDKEREIVSDNSLPYNFIIEGDNLHSLKLLEKTHKSKIDVIYIDPPYNTGNKDFIYDDKKIDNKDNYRHSKWMSFIERRLRIAKRLLNYDGIIFISIDDNEQAQLKLLCDEIFGEQNFVGNIVWEKRTKCQNTKTAKYMLQSKTEYVLVYKNKPVKYEFCLNFESERKYPELDENNKCYRFEKLGEMSASGMRGRETMIFEIDGVYPKTGYQWKLGKDTIEKFRDRGDLEIKNKKVYLRIRPEDEEEKMKPFWSLLFKDIGTAESAKNELNDILGTKEHGFETVKPVLLVKDLLYHVIANKKDAVILDFFAGSGTTAQAVIELNKEDGGNRKFILCTNNESNICENITYQRCKTVIVGQREDGSQYSDGLSANLKYYKTDFIDRYPKDETLTDLTLQYTKEMIQLENAINIDDRNMLVFDEEDAERIINQNLINRQKLYISSNVLLSNEQKIILKDKEIAVFDIPDYYFNFELKEVGE